MCGERMWLSFSKMFVRIFYTEIQVWMLQLLYCTLDALKKL